MDTFHCTPRTLCVDAAFQSTDLQEFFRRFDIKLVASVPYTLWPTEQKHQSEFSRLPYLISVLKIGSYLELKQITVRELLRTTSAKSGTPW